MPFDASPELLHALAWRSMPHSYAERMSEGRWRAYRWLRYLSEQIAQTIVRGNGRLIINAPPQHGKSELLSRWLPTWYLDNLPQKRVIVASYGSDLATDHGRKVRNEFETNPLCITRLRPDSSSANRWNTPEGGGMVAVGIGGPLSGRGGDLMLVDDPIKNMEEAFSLAYRRRCVDWFNSVLYTRRQPHSTIILLMTRWHEDDLAGYLMTTHVDKWRVIRLPALAMEDDPLGRAPGEPLCPERFGRDELLAAATDSYVWEALYQQNPSALGSGRVYESYSGLNLDNTIELRKDLPLHASFDFNINPGMHVVLGQYDHRADAFTARHEIHGPRMNLRAAMEVLVKLLEKIGGVKRRDGEGKWAFPELHVFGDASGKSESVTTGESCYDLIKAKLDASGIAYRVRRLKANPPVIDRINDFNAALRDMEGRVHYRVHPDCVRLLADFGGLKTDENGLIDKHDLNLSHASDAEGYRVNYLRPVRPKKLEPQRASA